MGPLNQTTRMPVRKYLYLLIISGIALLSIGVPVFRSIAAENIASGTSLTPRSDRSAARAVLEDHLKNGSFELMSAAKQQQLLSQAGLRYEGGVLKEAEPLPSPGGEPAKNVREGSKIGSSPLTALANPLVNNPGADATAQKTQSTTAIVLTGANNAVASFDDSGSFLGGVNSFTGYSTTTDMGSTWTDRGIVPLLGDQNFGDPVLARSAATGTVFLSTLAGGANGINIFSSFDGGVTFTKLSNGAPTASSDNTDKEWISVDNFAGTGSGNLYHAYRDFGAPNGIFFTRSTDDGTTFSTPLLIASGAIANVQGAFVFVGSDHAVYTGYYDATTTPDRIAIRKSTDQGVTFATAVGVSNLTTTGTNGSLNVPAGYRSSAFPQFVASPINANLLFCVHPDITIVGGSDSNIFFNQSTDGGVTWSASQKLNTDPGTNVQNQPAIAITPDGSALCVTWQDNRTDPANRKVQRFGVIGTISGSTVTFSPNFQVSQPNWSPVFGQDPIVNPVYMGDYDAMVADNSFFYSTFLDCRLGDQDVRFAKIPKAGPGAIIGFGGSTPTNLAVATSTCNDLFVTLSNNGTTTASGVSATFTTATPGVTLLNATQSYGNLAPGASAANATAIKLSIDNTFVCGTSIVIDVAVSTGESFSFTISTQGLGYTATTMTGQAIVPGTTNIGNATDDGTTFISLPFVFTFYGQPFTGANVCSNGNLQFSSNNTAFTNACPLPTATMNNLISAAWDDYRTDRAGDGIFTSVSGIAPNRIFNIEWRAKNFAGATGETEGPVNFEIRLYETTGQIDVIYGDMTANGGSEPGDVSTNGASATCGIQKGTGVVPATDVTQFSCNQGVLVTGLKVTFTLLTNCPTGTGACAGSSCVLTCPANITTSSDPNQCGAVVNYPAPTSTGTCGTITCTPPSGSFFPVGTTSVTCTSVGPVPVEGDVTGATFVLPPTKPSTPSSAQGYKVSGSGGPISGRIPTASYNFSGFGSIKPPSIPQSPFAVLYSQMDNPAATASSSQNFEPAFDTSDDQVADDFVVPAGENWTVSQVFVDGLYFNGPGPASSVNVVFYSDSSTLPGSVVATRANQTMADVAGDFTVSLSPTVVLSPGTYWVSVQANMNFNPNGQWGWIDRTTTSNSGSAFVNPGGGLGTACTPNFGRKTTCIPTSSPDCIFQILGTSSPTGGGSSCTFTITVQDVQPPSITCPPNQTAVTNQNACPAPPCTVVSFQAPVVVDNCPGVTVVCNPPAGSCFPVGVTTVTCTATDASANTATCSFTVTTFDTALQDDSNPSTILLWNSVTGSYRFCCNGVTYTGTGKVIRQGCVYTLEHNPVDRRVNGKVDKAVHSGNASIQSPPGVARCTIFDKNTLNDTLLPACQ